MWAGKAIVTKEGICKAVLQYGTNLTVSQTLYHLGMYRRNTRWPMLILRRLVLLTTGSWY